MPTEIGNPLVEVLSGISSVTFSYFFLAEEARQFAHCDVEEPEKA